MIVIDETIVETIDAVRLFFYLIQNCNNTGIFNLNKLWKYIEEKKLDKTLWICHCCRWEYGWIGWFIESNDKSKEKAKKTHQKVEDLNWLSRQPLESFYFVQPRETWIKKKKKRNSEIQGGSYIIETKIWKSVISLFVLLVIVYY